MNKSTTTRSRKLVKIRRKADPTPKIPEPRAESRRQATDWLAAPAAVATTQAGATGATVVSSKLVALWTAGVLAVGGGLSVLAAAGKWVYDASAASNTADSPSARALIELPPPPRADTRGDGQERRGQTNSDLGGSGRAGRMVLSESGAGSGTGGAGGGAATSDDGGPSSICVVQLSDMSRLEETLRGCLDKHEKK